MDEEAVPEEMVDAIMTLSPVDAAMLLQRNKAEIDRLTMENKTLVQLLIGEPQQTWVDDGVRYRVEVSRGRRMFRMDEDMFRIAVVDHEKWSTLVPDKARIQKAIEEHRFTNWQRWATITLSAPYPVIKKSLVNEEDDQ